MVPILSLLAPVLVAAVLVFLASFILHMVLPYHRSDFRRVESEDALMESLRKLGVGPGNYMMPHAASPSAMKDPAFVEKKKRGPVAVLTVMRDPSMGVSLAQWFVYCVVVSVFAAYIAGRALGPGAEYLEVFRFSGAAAFGAYGLALWQNSIWYKIAWSTTLKSNIDSLIYGLLTGGAFGWLWPA
ncbi:MAG TPA: hypothetical protein VFM44_00135 [Gemmatimonadota bacterium]|jgi:hypothetical protein|nr:hypothetical protein [Gemmatimonadota bacterium]